MSTKTSTTNKKKSTPGGVQITEQDYSTIPGVKSEAEVLFEAIGLGKENVLKVSNGNYQFRKLVAEANMSGDCIINIRGGYYRPGPDDEDELKHYLYRELHRAKMIDDKVQAMREAFYGRY